MTIGTVKWFNEEKGYGFICAENSSQDIFVHITEVRKANIPLLFDNQKISFEKKENKGRVCAINLKEVD